MKELKSERVFLRAMEPEDVDLLFIWENDLENWRVSGTKAPFTRNVLMEFAQSTQDIFLYKQIRFMICLNDSDQAVGTIDLFDYDPVNRSAGIGILIHSDADRGSGFASEALSLIRNYGVQFLNLKNLFANMHGSNKASVALFEKAGFAKVGERQKNLFLKGEWEDELFYQLILD